jgi:hypothetical protein
MVMEPDPDESTTNVIVVPDPDESSTNGIVVKYMDSVVGHV